MRPTYGFTGCRNGDEPSRTSRQDSIQAPRLEIAGLIGAGGMGAVHRARQPALDRQFGLERDAPGTRRLLRENRRRTHASTCQASAPASRSLCPKLSALAR